MVKVAFVARLVASGQVTKTSQDAPGTIKVTFTLSTVFAKFGGGV